jgi:hypothetical protein
LSRSLTVRSSIHEFVEYYRGHKDRCFGFTCSIKSGPYRLGAPVKYCYCYISIQMDHGSNAALSSTIGDCSRPSGMNIWSPKLSITSQGIPHSDLRGSRITLSPRFCYFDLVSIETALPREPHGLTASSLKNFSGGGYQGVFHRYLSSDIFHSSGYNSDKFSGLCLHFARELA